MEPQPHILIPSFYALYFTEELMQKIREVAKFLPSELCVD